MRDQRDPEKLGRALLGLRREASIRPIEEGPWDEQAWQASRPSMSELYDDNRVQLDRVPDFKEGP